MSTKITEPVACLRFKLDCFKGTAKKSASDFLNERKAHRMWKMWTDRIKMEPADTVARRGNKGKGMGMRLFVFSIVFSA
jgi:hypothetical protein